MKSAETLLPLYERATRNCPWSVELWIGHLQALEHCNQPHDRVAGEDCMIKAVWVGLLL